MEVKRRISRMRRRGLAVVLSAVIALACSPGPAAAREREMTDRSIADAIETEFIGDPAVPANDIDLDAADGIVTLTGRVNNVLAKDRAERIAETVKGVRSVVNRLEVRPLEARMDWEIEADVKAALARDPATESWEIYPAVTDGVVTLTGRVDSWRERRLAGRVAKGVRGVEGLKNRIEIRYAAERLDGEIEAEIEGALAWDRLVDHAMIEVQVENGKVALTGTVGSAAEKRRAMTDAWVLGVRNVDTDGLEVKMWARNERLRKDKYAAKSDSEIEAAVHDALARDPRVLAAGVTPDAEGGVVTLRGRVADLRAKRAAAEDARNTVGIVRVVNRLKVRPERTPPGLEIQRQISEALAADPYLEATAEIVVGVVGGTARLDGIVDTLFEKQRAEALAATVPGVRDVRNNLRVIQRGQPALDDPYVDQIEAPEFDRYDWQDYEVQRARADDEVILEDIRDELWWSPFVDSEDVAVKVDDGFVTLEGTVDTTAERNAAVSNAYEGGAVWVYDHLKVD
jgi:osmotically-inducible protein OsmY